MTQRKKTDRNKEELFKRLYKQSSDFHRAVAVDQLFESIPNDYGTDEVSNMTEAHMMIDICDNNGISVGELAAISGRTASAISQIVSKLEKKGYLYKQRTEHNYRSYHVYPTKKGSELAEAHKTYDIDHISALNEYLLQYCKPEEIDTFYKVLNLRTDRTLRIINELRGNRPYGEPCVLAPVAGKSAGTDTASTDTDTDTNTDTAGGDE